MSHMIKGRTYRNIPTTNEQKPTGPVEPHKLNVITTAIIPEKTKPDAEPVGMDLSKMITTHDEPKPFDAEAVADRVTLSVDGWKDQIQLPATAEIPEAKKKAGRPKKAE